MSTIQALTTWFDEHQEVALDLVRAYLGIGLFVRGVLFINEPAASVEQIAGPEASAFWSGTLVHYVAFAHLCGGAMMAIGLLTRIAALVQIPVLFGAVFIVHAEDALLSANQSLEFSALVLFLLIVVFAFGSGRWSADYYIFKQEPPADEGQPRESRPSQEAEQPEPQHAASSSEGGTAVAERQAATATQQQASTCTCGHDVHHPRVTVEPRYSTWALLYFLMGISAPVKEVVFWCEECGRVLKQSREPELLQKYRYRA